MKKPCKPSAPSKPIEPSKTLMAKKEVGRVDLYFKKDGDDITDEIKGLIDLGNPIILNKDGDYYSDELYLSLRSYEDVEYPNHSYDRQYKSYEKKLVRYDQKVIDYKNNLIKYEADLAKYYEYIKQKEQAKELDLFEKLKRKYS
jgi:hypothetical protein